MPEPVEDPWELLETIPEAASFIYQHEGEEFLRKALTMIASTSQREYFQVAVGELKVMGLSKVAAIVGEFAATPKSAADPAFCPHEPGTPAAEIWLKLEQRWVERYKREHTLALVSNG
jgi:hypothetical protein